MNKFIKITLLISAIVILLCAAINIKELSSGRIEFIQSNILKLLPPIIADPTANKASDRYAESLAKNIVVLVSSKDERNSQLALDNLCQTLSSSKLFSSIDCKVQPNHLSQISEILIENPQLLLKREAFERYKNDSSLLAQETLRKLYSPQTATFLGSLEKDPLLLLPDQLALLRELQPTFTVRNGYLAVQDKQSVHFVARLTLKESAFDRTYQQAVIEQIDTGINSIKAKYSEIAFLRSGIVFFAADSANRAESDIKQLSTLSVVLVSLIFLVSLRSVAAIAILILTTAASTIFAILGVILLTPPLNLLTLGFGVSVIGISSDYALHLILAARMRAISEDPKDLLNKILPGLNIALLTSIISYLALLLSPFPGLQQLGLFTIFGLFAAYLILLWLSPYIFQFVSPSETTRGHSKLILSKIRSPLLSIIVIITCALLSYRVVNLKVDDDIRSLQPLSKEILGEEIKIREIIHNAEGGQTIIVQGKTPEELLQREETVIESLNQAIKNGELNGYRAISKVIQSEKSQREQSTELSNAIKATQSALIEGYSTLGLSSKGLERISALTQGTQQSLSIEHCLNTPLCLPIQDLWLGKIDGNYLSVISLRAPLKTSSLQESIAKFSYAKFVDRAAFTSDSFRKFRIAALELTLLFYGLIWILLIYVYKFWTAVRIIAPTVLSAGCALGAIAWLSLPLSAFGAFGLIILLGIAIDYALFFIESHDSGESSYSAIIISALTTATSFGALYLSQTPAIQSFGLIVAVGVIVCTLLTPIIMRRS